MEAFFNEIWADRLQYITIWLEVVGFILTFIEVLFPKFADEIEKTIDDMSAVFDNLSDTVKLWGWIGYFFLPILLVVGLIIGLIFQSLSGTLPKLYPKLYAILGALLITIVVLSVVLLKSASMLIRLLNRLSNGRALGSLGLILAFLGVLGEAYQYITMVK